MTGTEAAVVNEFNRLAAEYNLGDWSFAFNSRLGITLGRCNSQLKRIEIGQWALDELVPEEYLIDAVRHEVAHALAGEGAGHGSLWKRYCELVGARPEAYYPAAIKPKREYRWEGYCTGCKEVIAHWYAKPRDMQMKIHTVCGARVLVSSVSD